MKKAINNIVKKYITPIKYIFSAGISFVLDQVLFNIFIIFLKINIFIIPSKLIARAISSFINYKLNSKVVFGKRGSNAMLKYYILVIVQAIVASISIYALKMIFVNSYIAIISIFVDIVLFIINYFVQKELIFK